MRLFVNYYTRLPLHICILFIGSSREREEEEEEKKKKKDE